MIPIASSKDSLGHVVRSRECNYRRITNNEAVITVRSTFLYLFAWRSIIAVLFNEPRHVAQSLREKKAGTAQIGGRRRNYFINSNTYRESQRGRDFRTVSASPAGTHWLIDK